MNNIIYTFQYSLYDKTKPCAVWRSDGWSIPFNEDNSDYQEYLKWVAEGNITKEPND